MNDAPPSGEEDYINFRKEDLRPLDSRSDAPYGDNVGRQEGLYNFHNLHNQSTVRSRGYGIGNPIVGLPPGAKSSYYTQPGSPYNDASIRPRVNVGVQGADVHPGADGGVQGADVHPEA